jgi:mitochondrial ornithine carrier protein
MAVVHHEASADPQLNQPTQPALSSSPSAALQSQGVEAFKDIAFGSFAGSLGKFVEYPFDTVKVRLQAQSSSALSNYRVKGPLDAFAVAWRSPEGPIKNLYRGISAPLLGAAIETSSLFFSYRVAQELLVSLTPSFRTRTDINGKIDLPFSALLACGAFSGAFTSILLTPIELIKCKMQVPLPSSSLASDLGYQTTKPPGPLTLIRTIFQKQGILGFWHGQLGTLIRETGGSAAWFGSYEGVKLGFLRYDKSLQNPKDIKIWQQLLAGATAGMAYNFVFYPADTIKSRMQTEETKTAATARMTFLRTGKELWKQQGLRGFYRGCGITVFRAAPSSAIIFSIYEGLRRRFG